VAAGGTRSIWLHQLAEYAIGAAMVASGLQSPTPTVPAVVGGLIILNAAIVKGPLGAFGLVGRRTHRLLDWVVVAIAVGTVAWPGVDAGTRVVQLGIAVVYAAVVWRTGVASPPPPTPPLPPPRGSASSASSGEAIGRAAGRVTAKGIRAVRRKLR
jgi:hypothetical protein